MMNLRKLSISLGTVSAAAIIALAGAGLAQDDDSRKAKPKNEKERQTADREAPSKAESTSVNTTRYDPYRNFKFKVKMDGKHVAGISKVSGLTKTTQVISHREGGDPSVVRRAPGQSEYDAITLERGVTHDEGFERWANKVWNYSNPDAEKGEDDSKNEIVSLKDFRKDIVLELFTEAGEKVLSFKIYRCWVSEFTAFPELDADGNAVAIQSLTLENEGWERDTSLEEPDEATVTEPAK